MATVLWRSMLISSFTLGGAFLGGWFGANYFVPKNAGLAGGAIVLGYVVVVAIGFSVLGAIVAFRLKGRILRRSTLIFGVPVLVLYLILTLRTFAKVAAEREPDSAFVPAGVFTATMERIDTSDPYLFVRMHVNSQDRTWTQTGPAPEYKLCSAKTKARNLIYIRHALDKLLILSSVKLVDCSNENLKIVKRLYWELMDQPRKKNGKIQSKKGVLSINAACQRKHIEVGKVISLIENISMREGGKVSCK